MRNNSVDKTEETNISKEPLVYCLFEESAVLTMPNIPKRKTFEIRD